MANALSVATRGKTTTRKRTANKGSSSLVKAQQQIARLQNRVKKVNASAKEGMSSVIHAGETQTALFATAYYSGRRGDDGLKMGNIDTRLLVGGGLATWGLWQAFNGEALSGNHALALGNGVLAAKVYEMGHSAGSTAAAEGFSGQTRLSGRRAHVSPRMAGIYR